ncbi:hypothetical protein [Yimella sp. cx-51]|uniref:hypothetical protein n=1 Tax=Yimella sp. cx-51 TaxID=2770551 RepID=UPI00165D69EE|nr:hypothetical protein [Yimella sp. cx-51]MBC9955893.1 hypothetical protein [Yimella sp. cx-51]QTH37564.1 hypothetical protein J5M86_11875 [Yimella sp. cx-51]
MPILAAFCLSNREGSRGETGFSVKKSENIIKVTRASGKVPSTAKKVRLTVTKNTANSYATETEINPKLTITQDPATKTPVVSGRYKTVGKGTITTLTSVCSDDAGVVHAATSPIPKIDAPESTDFKVKFLMAPNGFKPAKCYVGA